VSVRLWATPAVVADGKPESTNRFAAAAVTEMLAVVVKPWGASWKDTVCAPAVFRTTENVWTPASAAVKA
jgi:hypothetical protein